MTGYDQATLDFYAREAPVYLSSRPDGIARHLPDFLNRLPQGCRILELGCGGGTDAAYMISKGFAVTPTDGTAAIAAIAQDKLQIPVSVMRFDEIDSIAAFDAVIAFAALLHVPVEDLSGILHKISTALQPGGWHIATFKGAGMDTESRDIAGRYYSYPTAQVLEAIYRKAGPWNLMEIDSYIGGGHFGK